MPPLKILPPRIPRGGANVTVAFKLMAGKQLEFAVFSFPFPDMLKSKTFKRIGCASSLNGVIKFVH